MVINCTACRGLPFTFKYTGEKIVKPVYLGTIVGDQFVFKSTPCRNKECKKVNIVVKGVEVEVEPQEGEHVRYV